MDGMIEAEPMSTTLVSRTGQRIQGVWLVGFTEGSFLEFRLRV